MVGEGDGERGGARKSWRQPEIGKKKWAIAEGESRGGGCGFEVLLNIFAKYA